MDSLNEVHIEFNGEGTQQLRNEVGGHRLQRVPPTERKGRVHTSTVTVSVFEIKSEKALEIKNSDIKVEWYSGTGAGRST